MATAAGHRRLSCSNHRHSTHGAAHSVPNGAINDPHVVTYQERKYPLKQPANHKPPVQRWMLKLPADVTRVHTIYVGVQSHGGKSKIIDDLEQDITAVLEADPHKSDAIDTFRATDGFEVNGSRVWVAYFTKEASFQSKLSELKLVDRWQQLGYDKQSVGLWCEHFTTAVERLETNYSRLDHKPGLAQLPNIEQPAHDLTAYWGAGRDRLPAAADDHFEKPDVIPVPKTVPKGIGEHLTGTNYNNMCHIRSGQWWEQCPDDEREAYEDTLEPTLMNGMHFLWDNAEETGTIGLRFLYNTDPSDSTKLIKEACGAGFFRNWADLERWSSRHPSHLAIFNGAMKHAKRFGDGRKLMTWHEVSILKEGDAGFEYVSCVPETGVMKWVEMERKSLLS